MMRKDDFIIFLLIIGFISIRALHFASRLNFSTDQAVFSQRALEIWRQREITLVGPTASFSYEGRFLIQSSAIFYTMLAFLLMGGFDPVLSSWAFMLAASLMCWPLYVGVKLLWNRPAAILVTAAYVTLPVFVSHTRFLWNPNFQLVLMPLAIWAFGQWWATRRDWWLGISGLLVGVAFLFHYQLLLLIVAVTLYLLWLRFPWQKYLWWIGGLILGYSPLLLFEVNSGFYLTQTVGLLLAHPESLTKGGEGGLPIHYILSLSFSLMVLLVGLLTQRWSWFTQKKVLLLASMMWLASFGWYALPPSHAYGMPDHWNYLLEEKAHQIIAAQDLESYAVANTLYETTASVQYFLLEKNQEPGYTHNYYENRYLYVIAPVGQSRADLLADSAYELNSFVPSRLTKVWPLNEQAALYLLARTE